MELGNSSRGPAIPETRTCFANSTVFDHAQIIIICVNVSTICFNIEMYIDLLVVATHPKHMNQIEHFPQFSG